MYTSDSRILCFMYCKPWDTSLPTPLLYVLDQCYFIFERDCPLFFYYIHSIIIIIFTIINSDYNLNDNNISTIFTEHPYCCVNNTVLALFLNESTIYMHTITICVTEVYYCLDSCRPCLGQAFQTRFTLELPSKSTLFFHLLILLKKKNVILTVIMVPVL